MAPRSDNVATLLTFKQLLRMTVIAMVGCILKLSRNQSLLVHRNLNRLRIAIDAYLLEWESESSPVFWHGIGIHSGQLESSSDPTNFNYYEGEYKPIEVKTRSILELPARRLDRNHSF